MVGNRDVEPFVPTLIGAMLRPTEASEAIHKLGAVTFVQVLHHWWRFEVDTVANGRQVVVNYTSHAEYAWGYAASAMVYLPRTVTTRRLVRNWHIRNGHSTTQVRRFLHNGIC